MTTDLITRAKDYLAKTEGITGQQEYWKNRFEEEKNFLNDADFNAMSLTPTARKLIEDFIQMMTEGELND